MSVEERKAELVLKQLHLGIFAVDQKKLNKYGKNMDLFGDRDVEKVDKKVVEAQVLSTESAQTQDIEDSVEYQELELIENADIDRDIFEEEIDEDLDDFFANNTIEEDDYRDMNEYAYENNYEE